MELYAEVLKLYAEGQRNFTWANLENAKLTEANLEKARLERANLTEANLDGAKLAGANLTGAKLNWGSHDLIAEILRQNAGGNVQYLSFAGLLLMTRHECWDYYFALKLPKKVKAWIIETLKPYALADENCPKRFRELCEEGA